MCEAGSDKPTGPRFGGRPGLELQNSRESLWSQIWFPFSWEIID